MLRLHINPNYPNQRHIERTAELLRTGALAVYPTDTTYGLGCDLYSRRTIDRIYSVKGMERSHRLSFLCSDLSEVARYAVIDNRNYRILRHHLPGKYTFILPASRDVPKILQSKTHSVGIRIPEGPVPVALVQALGHPLVTTTVARSTEGETEYTNDPDEIAQKFGRSIDVLLDGGPLYVGPSTVVDLTGSEPVIVRVGSGDAGWIEQSGGRVSG